MFAIDDGISTGNFNLGDVLFLVGTILGIIAAFLYATTSNPKLAHYAPVVLSLAVASVALGWFVI